MADSKPKLLIIEDDEGLQAQLKWAYEDFDVVLAGTRDNTLAYIVANIPVGQTVPVRNHTHVQSNIPYILTDLREFWVKRGLTPRQNDSVVVSLYEIVDEFLHRRKAFTEVLVKGTRKPRVEDGGQSSIAPSDLNASGM